MRKLLSLNTLQWIAAIIAIILGIGFYVGISDHSKGGPPSRLVLFMSKPIVRTRIFFAGVIFGAISVCIDTIDDIRTGEIQVGKGIWRHTATRWDDPVQFWVAVFGWFFGITACIAVSTWALITCQNF